MIFTEKYTNELLSRIKSASGVEGLKDALIQMLDIISDSKFDKDTNVVVIDGSGDYDLTDADNGKYLVFTHNGAVNVNTNNVSNKLTRPIQCSIVKRNTGNLTFVQGSGANLQSTGTVIAPGILAGAVHEGAGAWGVFSQFTS